MRKISDLHDTVDELEKAMNIINGVSSFANKNGLDKISEKLDNLFDEINDIVCEINNLI